MELLKIKVVHLISGLGKGGAETALVNLIRYQTDRENIQYKIISLGLSHYYENELKELGCELQELDIRHHFFKSVNYIIKAAKSCDLLCCWMYNSNVIGYVCAKLACRKNVMWFIRQANFDISNNKRRTLLFNRFCVRKSRSKVVRKVVYNGNLAKKIHEECGYVTEKSLVVNNGCDIEEYNYLPDARKTVYKALGLSDDTQMLLSAARYHPIKDIPTFLATINEVKKTCTNVVGVMCGQEIENSNSELVKTIESWGLVIDKDIILLGRRDDLPYLFSACDVYLLHSAGEAFPNTLIQAMSCGCLCVSTDVGDAKDILDKKNIVNVGDYKSMAEKVVEFLKMDDVAKQKIRLENNDTVRKRYDIKNVVLDYEQIFKNN